MASAAVLQPQQPVLVGTVNSAPSPNSLPLGYSYAQSVASTPAVSRVVVSPSSPIQSGTVWGTGIQLQPSAASRVVVRPGSPVGIVRSGSSVLCDPCHTLGFGQTVSEREYFAGPHGGQYLSPVPPARTLPILSEEVIGRKVDILEHQRVVRALEHRVVQLETQLVAAQQPNKEVPILQSRITNLEGQLAVLSGVQATAEGLRADLRYLDAENRQLEAVVRDLEARLRNQECAYKELTDRATRLANEGRQLDTELQLALRDRDQALLERDNLARQLGGVEQELLHGAAGVRAAHSHQFQLQSQLQSRVIHLEAELRQLLATLRLRDSEIKDLTQQLRLQDGSSLDFTRLKQDNIALIREVERSAEEIRILEAEVARLRGELAELRGTGHKVAGHRPMLGVEIKMLDDASGRHDSVVVVHTVTPHGPADRAGIHPGDVLKEWDGLLLDSKAKFQRLVDQTPPGTRIILTVVRGKSVVDIPVTMGSAPAGFSHHHRIVHSANQVTNVVQDRSIPTAAVVAGAGSRISSSRAGY